MTANSSALDPQLALLSTRDLRQLTYALLREWVSDVAEYPHGSYIDFQLTSELPLGLNLNQRYRLFLREVSTEDINRLSEEARAQDLSPTAIAPRGISVNVKCPSGMSIIKPDEYASLCHSSGILRLNDGGQMEVDRTALAEIRDLQDAKLALLNGLLWLRTLSRDRLPPALQWTGLPPHELFERCFYLVMTTTFRALGTSWGTRHRGEAFPDGYLNLPGVNRPTFYDCKASYKGYEMSYRDLTGFADYLRDPGVRSAGISIGGAPRFLIISSDIRGGKREASFAGRHAALAKKVPGAKLTWMRARDLVRFGRAIERAEVSPEHREQIGWSRVLDAGDVHWETFRCELQYLIALGYAFEADE